MADEVRWIDLNLIGLPARGRQHNPDRVAELAQDMAKNGQLQGIVVTPKGNGFEVVAGRGRYLAAKQLNWEKLQCLVKANLSDLDKVLLMISENDEREDVSPIDRGLSYKWAMEAGGMTFEALADKIGKTKGYISQYVSAASLPQPVLELFKRLNNLGIGHYNLIARLPTQEAQLAMLNRCQKEDLSVKQLENLVKKALNADTSPQKPATGNGKGKDAKTQPDGFRINKVGQETHIIGKFNGTPTLPELFKSLEETFQRWQAIPPNPSTRSARSGQESAANPQRPLTGKGKIASPPEADHDVIAGSVETKQSGSGQVPKPDSGWHTLVGGALSHDGPDIEAMKGMLKGGPGAMASLMIGPMEASLAAMKQRLADPNVSEAEKAKLKEGIEKMQSNLDKLKQK